MGGARSCPFCHQTEHQKQRKRKLHIGLDAHRSKYYHATTNQKHASALNDDTKEWFEWSGTQGGVLCIASAAIKRQYIRKNNNTLSILILFFLVNLHNYTRCAWAGGTFFPVVLLCQFFGFWQEIGFGVTYLRI